MFKIKKRRKYTRKKKYRIWIGFALFWVKLFTKKRKVVGELAPSPCVYLCRHRAADGVIGAFTSLKTVLRPWTLHIFTRYDAALKHLKEYTFPEKSGKSKAFTAVFAPVCALGLSSLVRSARAIPVYRGAEARRAITTIKNSVRALEEGDNLLVFPDVDYANADSKTEGEVYKGFVAVDKLYFRRKGERVKFVPVYIDEKKVVIHSPIRFGDEAEDRTVQKIVEGIYNE